MPLLKGKVTYSHFATRVSIYSLQQSAVSQTYLTETMELYTFNLMIQPLSFRRILNVDVVSYVTMDLHFIIYVSS